MVINMQELSLREFADLTASKSPVPGGGSISALCGGLSGALCEMVSNLTIGNKKYSEVEDKMVGVKDQAFMLRKTLMDDIVRDSDAFSSVMDAFKMSKESDAQKKIRSKAIQASFKTAANVPMEVAEKSFKVLELAKIVVESGNSNAVTDGMVCAMLARTAVLGALLNVKINLGSIKDETFVDDLSKRVALLEKKCIEEEDRILKSVSL